MDGLILVDKPRNYTSHDIILKLRKILKTGKIGHFGTLDPLATGLLAVAVGKATKLFPFFSKADKYYEGKIRLGYATDTYDAEGKPIAPEKKKLPEENEVLKAMKKFEGETTQLPPPFSAKKFRGKPLYKLARNNRNTPLTPSRINVYFFRMKDYRPPFLDFEVKCSSGTYIRSLSHDLGQVLGCGAHLTKLRRLEIGSFHLREAHTLEEIEKWIEEEKFENLLIPVEVLLTHLPKIILKESGSRLARNGNLIYPENILKVLIEDTPPGKEKEELFRLFSEEGRLLALARKGKEENSLHPFLVMS
ncbi:MAG: tRNA pseudouridine(55) synthase TruB [Candidatus Aminicenantales bacterium]